MATEIVILTMFFGTSLSVITYGYLRMKSKESLIKIEKGIYTEQEKSTKFFNVLKIALTLIGGGLGLFIAYLLVIDVFDKEGDHEAVYFSFTAAFAGIGLLIAYLQEKKNGL